MYVDCRPRARYLSKDVPSDLIKNITSKIEEKERTPQTTTI